MSPAIALLMLLLGLVLIVKGGDIFVDAAVWLAGALGLPAFLVGATVVSLATTLPELAVSLLATVRGAGGIAAGNAVGSVAANLGLILGVSLLRAPGPVEGGRQARQLLLMAGSAALLFVACVGGTLGPAGAIPLLLLCGTFLCSSAAAGRRHARDAARSGPRPSGWAFASRAVKFIGGAAGIAMGARLLSDYGAALARLCGVSEGVIGATLVAVGTSLPELVTALAALSRGEGGLAVGNVVGANIIDLTLILPLCAGLRGGSLPIPGQTLALDLPFCLALALVAVAPALAAGRFRRWQGAALVGIYGMYVFLVMA